MKNLINMYYQGINEYLKDSTKTIGRDYCYFFTHPNCHNLSISAEFDEENSFFYGISPSLSTSAILNAIDMYNSPFSNKKNFELWIKKNAYKYCANAKELTISPAVFARAILSVITQFYRTVQIDKRDIGKFELDYKSFIHSKVGETYKFSGCIQEGWFCHIDKNKILHMSTRKSSSNLSAKDFFIKYNPNFDNDIASLYNGVNNRLISIEINESKYSSKSNRIKLKIQRTSFFTTLGFENTELNNHPFLEAFKRKLLKIDIEEQVYQNELIKALNPEQLQERKVFNKLNEYLKKSLHTHYINVSCNVETKDNYLIYTKRGKQTFDNSSIYCSANGVSESFDNRVEYYNYSVEEDSPTIYFGNQLKNRIDFSSEILREIKAELNVDASSKKMKYYGIALLANNPKKNLTCLHFNILSTTKCSENFLEVVDSQKTAIEDFENDKIYGWKMNFYDSCWNQGKIKLYIVLDFFVNYSELLFAALFLISIIVGISRDIDFSNFDSLKILEQLKLLITKFYFDYMQNGMLMLLTLAIFILKRSISKKDRKTIKKQTHQTTIMKSDFKKINNNNKTNSLIFNEIEKTSKIKNSEVHYIYEVMSACYYLDKIQDYFMD